MGAVQFENSSDYTTHCFANELDWNTKSRLVNNPFLNAIPCSNKKEDVSAVVFGHLNPKSQHITCEFMFANHRGTGRFGAAGNGGCVYLSFLPTPVHTI